MKFTKEEINLVQKFDNDIQRLGAKQLDDDLANIFEYSKGKDWGWSGIAREDPKSFKEALKLALKHK